ncbi:Methyltransferase domain-containing protein [Zhouia amylolytica]|uniref:Type 11 methyltransferase n=2 Tax=Zhouia amylolytica TaxID=376730 RepID=W2UU02_9FLAO|nr:class I SAM-dependent methyltransferase [Zhouia amylolytica]ETN96797.1 type 11 methyltransferase [Zhouia amylolytica AD3]MCQ0111147.1 class I SAM-dependent methyltransferase [Zhouia amylolytica]SFS95331.1 Methyltransferase domain-containing protein [Zhouia amylolytica]
MKDLFGKAILDYQLGNYTEDIKTETSISEEDDLPLPYLFRAYDEMPAIEKKAMDLSKGRVLDVGCGAGSHSLYLQNEKHLEVMAIDVSEGAVKASELRGLKNVRLQDVMKLEGEQFDTILLLMNGAGMCGRLNRISTFLNKLKNLLKKDGQILMDSSDIVYMFDQDGDGGYWIPTDMDYYGEVDYYVRYKGEEEPPIDWLYIDYNTLQNAAQANGFNCELVQEGKHYDYLAKLTIA